MSRTSQDSVLSDTDITPMPFEQIRKFQCLKSSITQGLSHGTIGPMWHILRVPKRVSKLVNFLVKNL